LVDPILSEGDYADHLGTVEGAPEFSRSEQSLSEEPLIFVCRMETDEPRKSVRERSAPNQRRDVHVGKIKLSCHSTTSLTQPQLRFSNATVDRNTVQQKSRNLLITQEISLDRSSSWPRHLGALRNVELQGAFNNSAQQSRSDSHEDSTRGLRFGGVQLRTCWCGTTHQQRASN
jgi:hypothetical protein